MDMADGPLLVADFGADRIRGRRMAKAPAGGVAEAFWHRQGIVSDCSWQWFQSSRRADTPTRA